jgi:dTDP-4-dehydrorhamnose 3,5-epimerase
MPTERLVRVTELAVNVDDRGELFEVLRRDALEFVDFGQVYVVRSRQPGTVRAWHRHAVMWDHFCIVAGSAKFGFIDAEPQGDPLPPNDTDYYWYADMPNGVVAPAYFIAATDRKPVVLHVPPGVWHGWMALEPNTLLLSVASEPYMGHGRTLHKPDEERLVEGALNGLCFRADNVWAVQAR